MSPLTPSASHLALRYDQEGLGVRPWLSTADWIQAACDGAESDQAPGPACQCASGHWAAEGSGAPCPSWLHWGPMYHLS